jgi:hypothetical protein
MARDRFDTWRRGGIIRGQHQLADNIRLLIYKADADLFERMDFDDDHQFLEPLLFAYFTNPEPSLPLAHLLFGLIAQQRRPTRINLSTDADGRVHIPGMGELETPVPGQFVEFRHDPGADDYRCWSDGQPLPTRWRKQLRIPGTTIEVLRSRNPLFDPFFGDNNGGFLDLGIAQSTDKHYNNLVRAFSLLRENCSDLYDEIMSVTRTVVLYKSNLPNSFATLSGHGAVFFNTTEAIDEIFFIDDIAHQCGHVLFNAFTLNKEKFLEVDPMTPLAILGSGPQDPRTLYSAFHGLFTYTTISEVLSTFWGRQVFVGRQAHEVIGRLGFILNKFRVDLDILRKQELFTKSGWRCYSYFSAFYCELLVQYGDLLALLDYSNQPYVFSYPLFAERNPCLAPRT